MGFYRRISSTYRTSFAPGERGIWQRKLHENDIQEWAEYGPLRHTWWNWLISRKETIQDNSLISPREVVGEPVMERPLTCTLMSARDWSSWPWGTESKAFLISKKTSATWQWVDRDWSQYLVIVSRTSWVDDLGLKPIWQSERRLCLSKKSITLLWIHHFWDQGQQGYGPVVRCARTVSWSEYLSDVRKFPLVWYSALKQGEIE